MDGDLAILLLLWWRAPLQYATYGTKATKKNTNPTQIITEIIHQAIAVEENVFVVWVVVVRVRF